MPGLCARPSTSCFPRCFKGADGRNKSGCDGGRASQQKRPVIHVIPAIPACPVRPKTGHSANVLVYEYTPFCNGPGDVKSPRVIVTPPSSRFCPWAAPRPPHYAVRRNGEPI